MKDASKGKDLRFSDLRGKDLSGQVSAGADLTRATLSRCRIEGADLTGSVLIGADLSQAKLHECKLEKADLVRAALRGIRVSKSNLNSVSAAGALSAEAEFRSCTFRNAKMEGANFDFSQFEGCDLRGADVSGASFLGAKWTRCDLSKAVFAGADLSDVEFAETVIDGTDFSYADLNHAVLSGIDFREVKVVGARFWMCSGLTAEQKALIQKGGGSLYSPFGEKAKRAADFIRSSRAAQAALAAFALLLVIQILPYFVNPEKMSLDRLMRAASSAAEDRQFRKANSFLERALERAKEKKRVQDPTVDILQQMASNHRALGEHDRAVALIERTLLITNEPERRDLAALDLAGIYLEMGKTAEAGSRYKHLIDTLTREEDRFEAELGLCNVALAERRFEDALKLYTALLDKAKNLPELTARVHEKMAEVYNRLGKEDEAVAHLQAAQAGAGPDTRFSSRTMLFQLKVRHERPESALEMYRAFLKDVRDPVMVGQMRMEMARLNLELGRMKEARELYAGVISMAGEDRRLTTDARSGLADLKKREGHREEALKMYEEIVKELKAEGGRRGEDIDHVLMRIAPIKADLGATTDAAALYEAMANKPGGNLRLRYQARTGLADLMSRSGREEEALNEYEEILGEFRGKERELGEEPKYLLRNMARLYTELGRPKEAARLYEELLKTDKTGRDEKSGIEARLGLADLKDREGHRQEALKMYEEILKQYKTKGMERTEEMGDVLLRIAQIKAARSSPKEAGALFENLLKDTGKNDRLRYSVQLELAIQKTREGRKEEALKAYEEILKEHGEKVQDREMGLPVLHGMARINTELGRAREAERLYREILNKTGPSDRFRFEALEGLAELKAQEGSLEEALSVYRDLLKVFGEEREEWGKRIVPVFARMAQIYMDLGRIKEAERLFEDLWKKAGENKLLQYEAKIGSADLKLRQGLREEALNRYEHILKQYGEKDERAAPVLHRLALINLELDRIQAAERLYGTLLNLKEAPEVHRFEARIGLADLQIKKGRLEPALKDYEGLFREYQGKGELWFGGNARLLQGIERVNRELGRSEATKRLYREVSKTAGSERLRREAQMRLADNERQAGDPVEAARLYTEFLRILGDERLTQRAKMGLADLERRAGRFESALDMYGTILKEHGDKGGEEWADMLDMVLLETARLNADLEQWKEAERLYAQLLKRAGSLNQDLAFEARLGLADLERKRGRRSEAFKAYETILKEYGEKNVWKDRAASVRQRMEELRTEKQ